MDGIRANGVNGIRQAAMAQSDSLLSKVPASQDDASFAAEMGDALHQLSKLENNDKLREDAIQNAKAIIKNWTPPSDKQISTILGNMRKELLA